MHAQTGRFTSHTGVGPNVIKPSAPYAVPKNETFLPELLKDAGYSTHAVGKVSVGPSEQQGVVQLQCLCVEH
jgi:arylsulfatase A-like enzyme